MEFSFYDAPNTATIVCCHVLNEEESIVYASHDEEDGMWQFLCKKEHEADDARIISLKEAFNTDNSIGILKDMPCGYYAIRENLNDNWVIIKE